MNKHSRVAESEKLISVAFLIWKVITRRSKATVYDIHKRFHFRSYLETFSFCAFTSDLTSTAKNSKHKK